MPKKRTLHAAAVCIAALLAPVLARPALEKLGRGVVAVRKGDNTVFVSWRLLGVDPADVAFNLYCVRGGAPAVKLNSAPLSACTWFVDSNAEPGRAHAYFVRPVAAGVEKEPSATFTLPAVAPAVPYLSLPLRTPAGYTPNDASVGDLDGDGEYEIVLHQAGRGRDNAQDGATDPPILQAYRLDGTLLWQVELGINIREGAHYTQFIVYDLDGDGRAEVVCKTADGTKDGKGQVIGNGTADHRNSRGRILAGPEFLTVFEGLTGRTLATEDYVPPRAPTKLDPTGAELKALWGDDYGNRVDRFLACAAYLDGERPSVVMCRGYYARTVLAAWDYRNGALVRRWVFDSHDGVPANRAYAGQGNHNLSVGDVDGDGKDEIVYGGMVVDHDGKGLYSTGLGHGDAMHLADLNPANPGLEVFRIQERVDDAGAHMFAAATGKVLWKIPSAPGRQGPGRALALDVDPRHEGCECWVAGGGISGMYDCRGIKIAERAPPSCNMGVYWDGDTLRELLDGTKIDKWDYARGRAERLVSAHESGCAANNGSKANPCLVADLLGDWREEVLWRSGDNKELRVFTTTVPTDRRFPTLMHDVRYRLGIAWQNVAYNQPPHADLGLKAPPPTPVK